MATLTPEFAERYVELMNTMPTGLREYVRPVLGSMGVGNTRHVLQGGGSAMMQAHPYLSLVQRVANMSPPGLVPYIYRASLLKEDLSQVQAGGAFSQLSGTYDPGNLSNGMPPPMLYHVPPLHFLLMQKLKEDLRIKKAEENIVRDHKVKFYAEGTKINDAKEANLINGINESNIWKKVGSESKGKMKALMNDPVKSVVKNTTSAPPFIEIEFKCMTAAMIFVLSLTRTKCGPSTSIDECTYNAAQKIQSYYRHKSHRTYESDVGQVYGILENDNEFKKIIDELLDKSKTGKDAVEQLIKSTVENNQSNVANTADKDMQQFLKYGGASDLAKVDSAMHTWLTEMAMRRLVLGLESAKSSKGVLKAFHSHSPMIMKNMMAAEMAAREGWHSRLSTVRGTPLMMGGGTYQDFENMLPREAHAPIDPQSKYGKMNLQAWMEVNQPMVVPQNGGGGIDLKDL